MAGCRVLAGTSRLIGVRITPGWIESTPDFLLSVLYRGGFSQQANSALAAAIPAISGEPIRP